jgi:hypothetical protein
MRVSVYKPGRSCAISRPQARPGVGGCVVAEVILIFIIPSTTYVCAIVQPRHHVSAMSPATPCCCLIARLCYRATCFSHVGPMHAALLYIPWLCMLVKVLCCVVLTSGVCRDWVCSWSYCLCPVLSGFARCRCPWLRFLIRRLWCSLHCLLPHALLCLGVSSLSCGDSLRAVCVPQC